MNCRKRILLSKLGADGHDRGIMLVAMALKEAGMEVIYLGRHRTPIEVAVAAIQEDADIVGISSLADAHRELVPELVRELRARGSEASVILGGFIQQEDIPELKKQGVREIFSGNVPLHNIVDYIRNLFKEK